MKWVLIALTLTVSQAFATDYSCVSPKTQRTYEISTTFGEILVKNLSKQVIKEMSGLNIIYKYYRSTSADVMTFTDSSTRAVVAEIIETPRLITGHVKNDGNLVCTITR